MQPKIEFIIKKVNLVMHLNQENKDFKIFKELKLQIIIIALLILLKIFTKIFSKKNLILTI